MLRNVFTRLLVIAFLLPVQLRGSGQWQPAALEEPQLRLVFSDQERVVIDLLIPRYEITQGEGELAAYTSIYIPEASSVGNPGEPELPRLTAVLGVPADASFELRILLDEAHELPGEYLLAPVARPMPIEADFQPGQLSYEAHPLAYTRNAWFPESPARIGDVAWMRDQRILRVDFFPVQYLPAAGKLSWHRHLRVEVRFLPGRNAEYPSIRSIQGQADPRTGAEPFERIWQQSLLNYDQARSWRGLPLSAKLDGDATATRSSLAGMPRYKIVVDEDGLYRLSSQDLRAAGLITGTIDPTKFALYSQGEKVAFYVENFDSQEHVLTDTEGVLFYGQKFNGEILSQRYSGENQFWLTYTQALPDGSYASWRPQFNATMMARYTDENVYWLAVTAGSAVPMEVISPTTGIYPVPETYTATVRAEESRYWYSYSFTSEDTWYWDYIGTGEPISRTYSIALSALTTDTFTATLRGELVARNSSGQGNPDHHTPIWLNSQLTPLVDDRWDGVSRYRFEAGVPGAVLLEGANQIHVEVLTDTFPIQQIYVDWFEITYPRRFVAVDDQLWFTHAEGASSWKYQVSGFSSPSVDVLDITDPLRPKRVINAGLSSGTVTFYSAQPGERSYFLAGSNARKSPKSVTLYTPPAYFSADQGFDYLVITHSDFLTAAQELADYRASQGLSAKVIDVADLYNEFNEGIYNPIAIKNFLADALAHWAKVPQYVVLVGDGHFNFKGYPNYDNPPIYMPPNLAWVDPWQGEVDSANTLATLVGEDPLPDVDIGRIPVNSVAELQAVITKTMAYESAPEESWQRRFLFIADDTPDPAGDFPALSDELIAEYLSPELPADRVYLDDYDDDESCEYICPQANLAITQTLNLTGSLLASYSGHASVNRWAAEQIFTNANIASLANADRLPVVLSMTCLDGYWIHPNSSLSAMMEEMLRAPGKGAVATFSPTGLGVSTGHDYLQRGFLEAFLQAGETRLGPLARAAKLRLYLSGKTHQYDLLHTFGVLGDPALRLAQVYDVGIDPLSMTGSGYARDQISYTLKAINPGTAPETYTVSISKDVDNGWAVFYPATVGSVFGGGSLDFQVRVKPDPVPQQGIYERVTVRLASQANPFKQAEAQITTTAYWFYKLDLPLVLNFP